MTLYKLCKAYESVSSSLKRTDHISLVKKLLSTICKMLTYGNCCYCYHHILLILFYHLLGDSSSWISHISSKLSVNSQPAQLYVYSRRVKVELSSPPEEVYIAESLRYGLPLMRMMGCLPAAPCKLRASSFGISCPKLIYGQCGWPLALLLSPVEIRFWVQIGLSLVTPAFCLSPEDLYFLG